MAVFVFAEWRRYLINSTDTAKNADTPKQAAIPTKPSGITHFRKGVSMGVGQLALPTRIIIVFIAKTKMER